jgi:dihydroorotate dehydrogenase (fumarate)
MILVGADVTMVCSALLRQGIDHLRTLEMNIATWLEQHGYESLAQIKGIMSQQNCIDSSAFERAQYVHSLSAYGDPARPVSLKRGESAPWRVGFIALAEPLPL